MDVILYRTGCCVLILAGVFFPADVSGQPPVLQPRINAEGYSGLLSMPSADVLQDGGLSIGFSNRLNPAFHPQADRQRSYYFAFGFLPRLEIGARLFEVDDASGRPLSVGDIAPNIKLRLLDERKYRPALAVGSQDMYGTGFLTSDFIVTGKTWGPVRTTIGYGRSRRGSNRLDGLFYGAEAALHRTAGFIAEYDAKTFSLGMRLAPLRRLKADVMLQGRDRFALELSYQFDLHRLVRSMTDTFYRPSLKAVSASTRPPPARADVKQVLEEALIKEGMENINVRRNGVGTLQVEYEDRRDNSNELTALGRVLALTAQYADEETDTLAVIVKALNIPVLAMTVPKRLWIDFQEGRMTATEFAGRMSISNRPDVDVQRGRNASRFRTDLILRPGIQAVFGSEIALSAVRLTLRPDAVVQLGRGTVLQVGTEIPIGQTSIIFNTGIIDRRTGLRRAMLHRLFRWPGQVFTQTSAGVVGVDNYGVVHETLALIGDGRSFVKSTFGMIRDTSRRLNRRLVLVNYRHRIPGPALTAGVTVGQFLDNDRGFTATLSRYFGNNELNLFVRKTDQARGFLVGIGVALPLMPVRDARPGLLRVRLDNHYRYAQGIRATGGGGFLRSDIGNRLRTDHEIETVLFNRDRLYPVYIREHAEQLTGPATLK